MFLRECLGVRVSPCGLGGNERAEPGSNFFFPVKGVPGQIRLVPRQGDKTCVEGCARY